MRLSALLAAVIATGPSLMMCPTESIAQSDYPNKTVRLDRRLRARRLDRHRRAHRGAAPGRAPRPDRGGGEQGRRRRHDRRRRHRQGRARRLHAHARHDQHARHRGGRVLEAALRPGRRLHADLAGGDHALPAGRQSPGEGERPRRVRDAREGPAGQAQLRLRGQRHRDAPGDGDAQGRRGHRPGPRPVQGQRAGRRRDPRAAKSRRCSARCRRCCRTRRPTRCARSRSAPRRARRRCPTCPPWPSRAIPGSRRRCGWASWARPTCRKAVVDRLHKEIVAIVATPEFKAAMDANGAEPIASKSPGGVPRDAARPGRPST